MTTGDSRYSAREAEDSKMVRANMNDEASRERYRYSWLPNCRERDRTTTERWIYFCLNDGVIEMHRDVESSIEMLRVLHLCVAENVLGPHLYFYFFH